MSPYLAKDPRPDLSQGMSLKAVEEIEARAQEAQKYALEAESLSQQAQQASQEALAAIERKDRETVTEKCKEAERLERELLRPEDGGQVLAHVLELVRLRGGGGEAVGELRRVAPELRGELRARAPSPSSSTTTSTCRPTCGHPARSGTP